jgi:hypothetical protein
MQRGLNDVHAPNAFDSARGTVSASARRYQYSFFRMMFSRVTVKPINDAWSFSIASGLFPAFLFTFHAEEKRSSSRPRIELA